MVNLRRAYGMDEQKKEHGRWFPLSVRVDGEAPGRVKLASYRSARFQRVHDNLLRPHRKKMRLQTWTAEEGRRVLAEACAKALLLDWEGIEDERGNAIPFTEDNAREALLQCDEFFDEVLQMSMEDAAFRDEEDEEEIELASKNSDSASFGT